MFSKIGKQILQNFQEQSNDPILFSILDQSLRGNNIKSLQRFIQSVSEQTGHE